MVLSCRGFSSCWPHSAENVTVEGEKQSEERKLTRDTIDLQFSPPLISFHCKLMIQPHH